MRKTYEELIQKFSEDMAGVDAPVEEYREALRDAISTLQIDLEASEEG